MKVSVSSLKRALYFGSYLYLALPYLVFLGGWIRQPYATLLILLLVAGSIAGIRLARASAPTGGAGGELSVASIVLLLIPVTMVALVVGAGGWGFQFGDWPKHNAIFRDLVTHSWPVVYQVGGEQVALTYYTAYQLPAALAGKMFGWNAANHFLFLYTLAGLCLVALWIRLFTEVRWWWLFLVFVGLSGMDLVGQLIARVHQEASIAEAAKVLGAKIGAFEHLEWWSGYGFAQYSSMAALIVLVPNQAIAGWLLTSLILADARAGNLHVTALLYLGLCSLWAPFVGLGLIPIMLALTLYHWATTGNAAALCWQAISWPNAAGLMIGLTVAFYLAGRFESFTLPIDLGSIVYKEQITLTFLRLPELFLVRYLLFIILEFALLHTLLFAYLFMQREPMFTQLCGLLMLSSAILVLLPFLNWGWNNEPSMRSSIPSLFIAALVTIRVLADRARSATARWVKGAILGVVLVGGLTSTVEMGRQVVGTYRQGALIATPKPDEIDTIFEIQEARYREYHNFVGQYVGSARSRFMRHMAKP